MQLGVYGFKLKPCVYCKIKQNLSTQVGWENFYAYQEKHKVRFSDRLYPIFVLCVECSKPVLNKNCVGIII